MKKTLFCLVGLLTVGGLSIQAATLHAGVTPPDANFTATVGTSAITLAFGTTPEAFLVMDDSSTVGVGPIVVAGTDGTNVLTVSATASPTQSVTLAFNFGGVGTAAGTLIIPAVGGLSVGSAPLTDQGLLDLVGNSAFVFSPEATNPAKFDFLIAQLPADAATGAP